MPPIIDPPRLTDLPLFALPCGPTNGVAIPTGPESWYLTAYGYKEAADRLADSIVEKRWGQDPSAAPAMFLYRHYVELHLKSLLLDAGELLDEPQSVPPRHHLWNLWLRVRELLLQVDDRSVGPLQRAGEVIKALDVLDPTSFAFRYPVDNAGNRTLPAGFVFDVPTVKQVIGELHHVLEGASTQIAEYQSHKHNAGY